MKICLLGNARSIHCVRWANALRQLGHDVWLISLNPPAIHPLDPGVQIEILPFRPPLGYYLSFPKAKSIINKISPDILNTHYASGYGTLSRLVNFYPTLLSVWGSDVFDVPYQNKLLFNIIKKNLTAATRIASTSRIMKSQIESIYKPTEDIFITPFGVDLDLFKPTGKKDNSVITIGMVKSQEEKYGPIYLIKAFRIVLDRLQKEGQNDTAEKLRLLIVGDGPLRKEIQILIKQLSLDRITELPGEISHSIVPQYLNRMDILCVPSIVRESFGVSVLEASACEVAVIASDIGGLPEVLIDGETGLLAEPRNENVLADRIFQLVSDTKLRTRMGKSGRQFVAKNYDWNENVQRMDNYYYQIVTRNKRKSGTISK